MVGAVDDRVLVWGFVYGVGCGDAGRGRRDFGRRRRVELAGPRGSGDESGQNVFLSVELGRPGCSQGPRYKNAWRAQDELPVATKTRVGRSLNGHSLQNLGMGAALSAPTLRFCSEISIRLRPTRGFVARSPPACARPAIT